MANRSILIVRTKQPVLDWLRSLPDPEDETTTLEFINDDAPAYLLPEYANDRERDLPAVRERAFCSTGGDGCGWPRAPIARASCARTGAATE
jgi:hypothetical protein